MALSQPDGNGGTRSETSMPKRLFWMGAGYAGGAASSWWVQRKVKREVERVLPHAVRNEMSKRVSEVGDKALEATVNSPVTRTANKAVQKVRSDIDLTDKAEQRLATRRQAQLSLVDAELAKEPGIERLRRRARNLRSASDS